MIKLKIIRSFSNLENIVNDKYSIHSFAVNCAKMPKPERFDFHNRENGFFGEIFKTLNPIVNPCLYWFEAASEQIATELISDLDKFRPKANDLGRVIPVPNNNKKSKVLYVGIRQGGITKKTKLSHIAGRIYIHLGYYSKGSTQGLQLCYWANKKLTLNVVELDSKSKGSYLNILEKLFAIQLNPLCGKH